MIVVLAAVVNLVTNPLSSSLVNIPIVIIPLMATVTTTQVTTTGIPIQPTNGIVTPVVITTTEVKP